jgi:hypothetical protein
MTVHPGHWETQLTPYPESTQLVKVGRAGIGGGEDAFTSLWLLMTTFEAPAAA